MLAYMNDARLTQDGDAVLTFHVIEKFQKDKAFISKL